MAAALLASCGLTGDEGGDPLGTENIEFSFEPPGAVDQNVLLAAGDIADCDLEADELTASLLDDLSGVVVALGDLAYEDGTAEEFETCYDPTWGRHKDRTLPVLGNHEFESGNADGYFGYFGAVAGDPPNGYHSLDIGGWHVIVLNSNCGESGGCDAGDPQEMWLRADLAASDARCTVAVWHNPVFSSGLHGGNDKTESWWEALYEAGADVVLNGHDHDYERFAPQDPSGIADPDHGITQFVVGTGGANLRTMEQPLPNSVARNDHTYGLLELTLRDAGASWRFVSAGGGSYTDEGSVRCHGKP
jgi:hypothetical protein